MFRNLWSSSSTVVPRKGRRLQDVGKGKLLRTGSDLNKGM
jgi:hypothetical protein